MLEATAYLHAHQIVHRDLKPENILFKTRDEHSPIVIADFGIARHLEPDEEITSMAGSYGYAAPEVLLGKPHSFAVDMWSIGVIAYTLLCGYSPFRSDDKAELIRETTRGKVTFHDRFWKHVSEPARDFIRSLLVVDPRKRLSAQEALQHPWIVASCGALNETQRAPVAGEVEAYDLSGNIRENFNPRKKWCDAMNVIRASNALKAAGAARRNDEPLDSDSSSASAAEDGYMTAGSEAAAQDAQVAAAPAAGRGPAHASAKTQPPPVQPPLQPVTPPAPAPASAPPAPGANLAAGERETPSPASSGKSGFGIHGLVNSLKTQRLS